jgi:LMBR1 domain-containing protein 1
MEALWNSVFWMIPIWVFVLIPFNTFYYEADDGMLMAGTAYAPSPVKRSRFGQAACYQIFVFIIVGVLFTIMYLTLSDTKIPVRDYDGIGPGGEGFGNLTEVSQDILEIKAPEAGVDRPFNSTLLADMNDNDDAWAQSVEKGDTSDITLQVSVSTFFAAFMAWFGWFLFAIFGGIGMMAMPLDLILTYLHRPRHLDAVEYQEIQQSLRDRTNELVDVGELIKIEREQKAQAGMATGAFSTFSLDSEKRKAAKEERQAILGFKQAVYLLEEDVEQFKNATENYENYNALIPYIAIVLGSCAIIMSLFWMLQIIIYMFPSPPLTPFLNNYFEWFDKWFPLFGVLSVALFTVYLLLAALKGAFKVGIRFLFFHIHPMKPGKTYMSSFMFNIALVLLTALPVVQFCQEAFADYAAYSEIRQIFGVQIYNLKFFGWFWQSNFFVICFFAIACLTGIWLARKPNDQSASTVGLRDRLRAHQGGSATAS